MSFRVDHVWLSAPDADLRCQELAAATGLPVLAGWRPGGVLWSRGVRFANGPFIDLHNPAPEGLPEPPPTILLSGLLAEGQAAAARRGWRLKLERRDEAPPDRRSPWSLGYFLKRQGVLSHLALIEYEIDPAICEVPEFAAPLLELNSAPKEGARLDRIWIGAGDDDRAEANLPELGFTPADEVRHAGRIGRRFVHPVCDLVVCRGDGGVVRLDVSGGLQQGVLHIGPLEVVCT